MSDIRFNRWLHQSGTGGISQDSTGNIGIGTTIPITSLDVRGDVNIGDTININNASGIISATTLTATTGSFSGDISVTGNLSIAGTLTYEDVSNIDAVGIITAQSDIIVGGGLTVTGISTFNNDVKLLDNDKLKFGIGEDLQIYHDPANGQSRIVESGSSVLKIQGSDLRLSNTANTKDYLQANDGAAVKLFYNGGAAKFETTNTGAVVTGILTATSSITGSNYEIADISSSISDTAVDVFVYDTRKDSDGGAWRKRTTHTSWYNETLGTATRGTRKEFPAVAVIVAEADKVTIYDGDDPDLPMWMVFNRTAEWSFITYSSGNISSISASNGLLCSAAITVSGGLNVINFIEDNFIRYQGNAEIRKSNLGISGRNTNQSTTPIISTSSIVNAYINDVAMTVLPNAPVDPSTGLPVPTIAVATNGGISVIKDDGNVVDKTTTLEGASMIAFTDVDKLIAKNTNVNYIGIFDDIITDQSSTYLGNILDATFSHEGVFESDPRYNYPNPTGTVNNNADVVNLKDKTFAFGVNEGSSASTSNGINILQYTTGSDTDNNGILVGVTTSYNTGWMHGDIKGAFLSDTDATNAVGGDIALTSSISGTINAYASTGVLPADLVEGQKYSIEINVTAYTSGSLALWSSGVNYSSLQTTATGIYNILYTHSTDGEQLVGADTTGFVGTATVSVTIAELDRSVNNKGLQVFGTITKSAVATGADLVGYSGFTNSNYIKQPYTSDLDFGTGDFSVTWWQYITGDISASEYVYDRQGSSGHRHAVYYASGDSGTLAFYTTASSASEVLLTGINSYKDGWACYTVSRNSGGLMQIYVNGEIKQTTTLTVRDLTNTAAELFIGIRHSVNSGSASQAKFALMRFSKSVPSAEQIKKMYEDEKCLFQENAKATLYGSSDAVTALAFDDTTNLLHVGTSAGRSEFQGLRRINNTTDAVTTAISASNGLVAEQ